MREEEAKSLLRAVGMYAWGGRGLSPELHEEVERLRGALSSALDWGDHVRAALQGLGENTGGNAGEKSHASSVLDLLGVQPQPLDIEEARKLNEALGGAKALQDQLKYYSPEMHTAAFVLPPFAARSLQDQRR